MTYQVAYSPELNNALVGLAETIGDVPEGILVLTFDGDAPDMTKHLWSNSTLCFESKGSDRIVSPTTFMRLFTTPERLAIRALERDGDLQIIDAMALMNGTNDGVDLDDPDVAMYLLYLVSIGKLTAERRTEILNNG